jgi:signal transduction histidine kinase
MTPERVLLKNYAVKSLSLDSSESYIRGMKLLVEVVQELSLARDMSTIAQIVRRAARDLNGADGATFVLQDNGHCYYFEENAIEPLWKGQRFPMSNCVSGWVMNNAQTAVIPDIYADPRVPHEAYRPTFVKSMVMVPIRKSNPIGAIGNYWASEYHPTSQEIQLIEALANTTAVAMENVQVYTELEQRVHDRTIELEAVNKELETFSYSVSHDLKSPLRSINGFSQVLRESAADKLDEDEKNYLHFICDNTKRMGELIEALLQLSKLNRTELCYQKVNLSQMAEEIISDYRMQDPKREVDVIIQPDIVAEGDLQLLRAAMDNLLGNAWKYSSKKEKAYIEVGIQPSETGSAFYVRDNGAGFDLERASKLFGPFQRFHSASDFQGTGIGLATVARIIARHHGKIWAESELGKGATFYFTLN